MSETIDVEQWDTGPNPESQIFLKQLIDDYLPADGYEFLLTELAEDIEEPYTRVNNALYNLIKLNALIFDRHDDEVTIISRKPENVMPGKYNKAFPEYGPDLDSVAPDTDRHNHLD